MKKMMRRISPAVRYPIRSFIKTIAGSNEPSLLSRQAPPALKRQPAPAPEPRK
jgi:hypothetical protein